MTTNSLLPAAAHEEPLDEELLEVEEAAEEEAEDEEEEEQAPPQHDDSEELEMWMRQTRRAQLLTPEQEVSLARRVHVSQRVTKTRRFAGELERVAIRQRIACVSDLFVSNGSDQR